MHIIVCTIKHDGSNFMQTRQTRYFNVLLSYLDNKSLFLSSANLRECNVSSSCSWYRITCLARDWTRT